MATRTDLAGMLRDDSDSLSHRLHRVVANGGLAGIWRAVGNFQSHGTSANPMVCQLDGKNLSVEGIENLVSDLEHQIVDKVGSDPRGKMKIRVYERGNSQKPEIDMTRTIDVRLYTEEQESIQQLKAQLAEERNHSYRLTQQLEQMMGLVTQNNATFATLAVQNNQAVTTLGTARAQISTAGEAGTLNSAVGVLVMMLGLPLLRQVFDMPRELPLTDVIELLTLKIKHAITGDAPGNIATESPTLRMPSTPLELTDDGLDQPADELSDDTQDDKAQEQDRKPTPETVVGWVKTDVGWAQQVLSAMQADPFVSQLLRSAS